MKLNAQDLKTIVNATLEHYNRRAEEYWACTRDHDVSQNNAACCNTSRVSRVSQYLILAAGPGETSKWLPNSVTSRSVWKARTFRRHGARLQRLRSLAVRFSQAPSSE